MLVKFVSGNDYRYTSKSAAKIILRYWAGWMQGLLILVSVGCSTQTPLPDNDKVLLWEEKKLELEQVQSWKLKARIAIQLDKEGGTASMNWSQKEDDYVIRIIPPLGRGTFELNGNSEGVTMTTADNQILHARDPEALLQTHLGWQVPLTGLLYWIRGLPDPVMRIKTMTLDEQARIQDLSQDQWQISYTSYTESGDLHLPKKLQMQNRKLKVKLLVKTWDLSL
jgi:outer membrane lipoprotein LolB